MKSHTVILGAGATIAAIPNGDKNGRKSSVMKGLIQKLSLDDILKGVKVDTRSDNLEDIYSELYSRPECKSVLRILEKRLYDYFASLQIPDNPTIYDYLILSLTEKDIIATFNWDPLLIQAYERCRFYTDNLPHILSLHGNVAIGYCSEHQEFGMTNAECPVCRKSLSPIKLLYPVEEKDYTGDEFIKGCWDATEDVLNNSYMLTIFGYSAPTSDKKAIELLKKAWGDIEERQLEEVSIIDIIEEEEAREKWSQFIYSHHYNYTKDFFSSYLGMFPRRSCETVLSTFNFNIPADSNKGFHPEMTWDDIETMLQGLLQDEWETPEGKNLPLYYTSESFRNKYKS